MERAEHWETLRSEALRSSTPSPGGLRLVYDRSPRVDDELVQLVEAERVCCGDAGITWTLTLGETAVLDVGVPAELVGSPAARIIGEVLGG